jgi:hypothetical protein
MSRCFAGDRFLRIIFPPGVEERAAELAGCLFLADVAAPYVRRRGEIRPGDQRFDFAAGREVHPREDRHGRNNYHGFNAAARRAPLLCYLRGIFRDIC